MLGRIQTVCTVVMVSSIGLITSQAATAAGPQVGTPTDYALTASGYATVLSGGGVPADSGKTAFQVISCTNQAGLSKWNTQASIPLTGLASVSGAATHTWTTSVGDKVSAWANHKIAKVTFVDVAGLGTLSLDGIVSLSHAYHDGTGYHATSTASLGSITLTLLGIPVDIPVPPAGQTIVVPGVAELTVGAGTSAEGVNGASASVSAVTVHFIPTDTTVVLASSRAEISGQVRSALFRGSSTGAEARAAGGAVRLGKTPYLVMQCRGTGGHVRTRDVASGDLGALGTLGALSTSEYAKKTLTRASSWQQADVADVSLLGNSLQITGVVARASATYVKGGQVQTSSEGTQVAQATLNGTVVDLPEQGTLELPGVASITTDLEVESSNGLSVTALRIALLDGSGVTIDLGTVRTFITPSGL